LRRDKVEKEELKCDSYDDEHDSYDNVIDNPSVTPSVITTTPYAMGDPHITTIYNKYYTIPNIKGIIRMFSDGELTINAELDVCPSNSKYPVYKDLTFIKYLGIKYQNEQIIVDMFAIDTYYRSLNNKNKIEKDNFFQFRLPQEIPHISKERVIRFNKLANKNKYELRYIEFNTRALGKVYIELMYSPDWRDFINSVNLISNGLSMSKCRGALVSQMGAVMVDNLI